MSMAGRTLALILLLGLQAVMPLRAAEETMLREAYTQPLPGLSEAERERFFRGRSLFRQSWVVAPAEDRAAGLGPLYNRLACISCHQKNGRGRSPDGPHYTELIYHLFKNLFYPFTESGVLVPYSI